MTSLPKRRKWKTTDGDVCKEGNMKIQNTVKEEENKELNNSMKAKCVRKTNFKTLLFDTYLSSLLYFFS